MESDRDPADLSTPHSLTQKGSTINDEDVKNFNRPLKKAEREAAKWFEFGRIYQHGDGVKKDEKEAIKWFTRAAEQGYAKVQNNLGRIYTNGNGVAKDKKEAIRLRSLGKSYTEIKARLSVPKSNSMRISIGRTASDLSSSLRANKSCSSKNFFSSSLRGF